MTEKTPPNLRTQIVDAMRPYFIQGSHIPLPETVFDQAVMPVLQKAMDAGQLLVGRNTATRIPVHEAVITFLQGMRNFRNRVRENEATVSKRQLLTMLNQLGDDAERALKDASGIEQAEH